MQMMLLATSGNRMTVHVAVVALLVLISFVYGDSETAGSSNLLPPTQKDDVNAQYPTVSLKTDGITKAGFQDFMNASRYLVVSTDKVENISRLRNPSSVTISKRFILAELFDSEKTPVTLAIDVTNLYVVGYRTGDPTGDRFYYFNDSLVNTSSIFDNLNHTALPFNSSYPALEKEAGARTKISLGIADLIVSIDDLRHYRRSNLARSFLVVIQMVSEAIRFRYIENLVVTSIGTGKQFNATGTMVSLENNWGTLSEKIQNSIGGEFPPPPVKLEDIYGKTVNVCLVSKVRINIAVMLYVSNTTTTKKPCSTVYDSRQGWLLSNNTEPIVTRIVGFKDLCLQANDGNTVWIEKCVSNKTAQEWEIYAESTIRPNGNKDNCLTLKSENVVIDTCNEGAGQRWQFKNDGSILNVATGLVMDVKDSDENQIIVSSFSGTASQIWEAWLL